MRHAPFHLSAAAAVLAMPLALMVSGCALTLAGESGPPPTYLPLLYSQLGPPLPLRRGRRSL